VAGSLVWSAAVIADDLLVGRSVGWQPADLVYPLLLTPLAMLVFGVPVHFLLRLLGINHLTHRLIAGAALGSVLAGVFLIPAAVAILTGTAVGATVSAFYYRLILWSRPVERNASAQARR